MNVLALLLIFLFILGSGASVIYKLRIFNNLKFFELCSCSIITGGLLNYLLLETIGRWSLTIWTIGISYAIIGPFAIYGLILISRRVAAIAHPILIFFRNADFVFLLLTGGCLALLGLGLVQAFAPPNTYDTLNYHLFLPQYDVARGYTGPRWDHNTSFSFFPSYLSDLTRTALLFGDATTAQLINVIFVGLAAAGAANLALYLSNDARVAAFSSFLVLTNRAVTWQMPTLEIDAVMGAFAAIAAALFLKLREEADARIAVLLGIVVGCSILSKYHGFLLALSLGTAFILIHARSSRADYMVAFKTLAIVAVGSLVVISPHLVRNFVFTSDPVYPLFDLHREGFAGMYGTGRSILDLVASPVLMGLMPRTYFDGMMFGAPILLALVPFSALVRPVSWRLYYLWVLATVYYIMWFYFLSQQTRFLLPVLPIFAVISALGVGFVIKRLAGVPKGLMMTGMASLFAVQSCFVGIYTLLRAPVALGLQSKDAFFRTPSFDGALYEECKYVENRLSTSDRILALTFEGLSYCPPLRTDYALTALMTGANREPRNLSITRWLESAKQRKYAFVIIRVSRAMRHKDEWSTSPVTVHGPGPLQKWFKLAIESLTPIAEFSHIKVFSGPAFLANLEALTNHALKSDTKPQ